MSSALVMIGRILLGLFFVISGLAKIKGGFDAGGLGGLAGYITSKGLPQPLLLAYATIALEVVGGHAIVFGFLTMPVALVFAVFCLATAGLFHNFWAVPAEQFQPQFVNFMKNIGLAGAFLTLAGSSQRS